MSKPTHADRDAAVSDSMSPEIFGGCHCSLGLTRCDCGLAGYKQPAIPAAALIPRAGQSRLEYVPAAQTDLRQLFAKLRAKQ